MDPGGFMHTNLTPLYRSILKFSLLFAAWVCFFLQRKFNDTNFFTNKFVFKYLVFLFFWFAYYFIWYFGFNNNETFDGILTILAKNARIINSGLFVFPIIYFVTIDLTYFIKLLAWSSIIIIILFILSIYLGLDLINYLRGNRLIIDVNRYFMRGYGLIYFLIPLSISTVLMKFKIKQKKLLFFSGALTILLIFFTLWRRDMIGLIEYLLIISFFVNYMKGGSIGNFLHRVLKNRIVVYSVVIIFLIAIFAPNIISLGEKLIYQTYLTFSGQGNEVTDVRLSLSGKTSIINAIKDNFFLGTGYDNDWMTGDGGKNEWEGSDYIFLSSFAMYGLVGLVIFLPFYMLTVRIILKLFKLLRRNYSKLYSNERIVYAVIVGLAASAEFVKNIIEFPNWFYPIGASALSPLYFFYFGFLLGSYYVVKKEIYLLNSKEIKYEY